MATPTLLQQMTGVDFSSPAQAVFLGAGFAVVIVAAQVAFKIRRALHRAAVARRQRAPRRPVRPDMVATIIGAGLVLALSIEGMWRFFGGIGMPPAGRIAFAAVFEICLLAVALRARHIRLLRQARRDALMERRTKVDDGTIEAAQLDAQIEAIRLRGLNDFLVWVLAAVIGTLAALEAPSRPEQVARFIVPFIAATMWELALGADVEDQRVSAVAKGWGTKFKAAIRAVGRFFVSVAIAFGWVPPTSANATAQFREKLMTRLVSVSHEIHIAAADASPKLFTRQRKLILDLQARGQWSADTMNELAGRLDVLYRARELTAPDAVRPRTAAKPIPVVKPAPVVPVALPALPVEHAAPALVTPPVRRRRTAAPKVDPDELAAAFKRLYLELGKRPSVRELGAAGVVDGEKLWSKSSAHKWMTNPETNMPTLEAEALTEAAAALEGVSA